MTKDEVVELLAETARRVGLDSKSDHPEDIGTAMIIALEGSIVTLTLQWEKERNGAA